MYSIIMLQYIILSYFIIKTVVNTSSLLTFYIIIPILNKLNSLFYNNILLNVTLENTKIEEIVEDSEDDTEDEDSDESDKENRKDNSDKENRKDNSDKEILVDETLE